MLYCNNHVYIFICYNLLTIFTTWSSEVLFPAYRMDSKCLCRCSRKGLWECTDKLVFHYCCHFCCCSCHHCYYCHQSGSKPQFQLSLWAMWCHRQAQTCISCVQVYMLLPHSSAWDCVCSHCIASHGHAPLSHWTWLNSTQVHS